MRLCITIFFSDILILLRHDISIRSDISFSTRQLRVNYLKSISTILFIYMQDPSGTFIHPSGSEHHIGEHVNILGESYGDKKGKQYRIWVDGVLATQIGSDAWLIKFDKWESCGEHFSLNLL